jgi:hypothetical protein
MGRSYGKESITVCAEANMPEISTIAIAPKWVLKSSFVSFPRPPALRKMRPNRRLRMPEMTKRPMSALVSRYTFTVSRSVSAYICVRKERSVLNSTALSPKRIDSLESSSSGRMGMYAFFSSRSACVSI